MSPSRFVALVLPSAFLLLSGCVLEVEASPANCAAQSSATSCEALVPVEGEAPGRCEWTVQRKLTDTCGVDGEVREACVYIDGAAESCDGAACTQGEQHLWVDAAGWTIFRQGDCSGTPVPPGDEPAFTACTDDTGVCACACESFDDGDTTGG